MDQGSRRRLLALHALLLMSAVQAVTPDARDIASSALLKLFALSSQPAQHVFNERDRSEEICREAQVTTLCESAPEADFARTSLVPAPTRLDRPDDARCQSAGCPTGLTGSARERLRSLCRLIC